MGLVADEGPVEAFGSCCGYPAFGETVRARGSRWCLDHVDAGGGEDGVEGGGELGVPVADQEPEPCRPVALSSNSITRFRAVWVTHSPTGCAVTSRRCTCRRSTSTMNRTYRRVRLMVSTAKKSAHPDSTAIAVQGLSRRARELGGSPIG